MPEIFESDDIIQGDTGPMWQIGVPSIDLDGNSAGYETLTDYTCFLVYTDSSGDEQTRAVTTTNTTNDRFLVQVTSAESETFRIGPNRLVCQIKNSAVTPYRSEVQIDVVVKPQRYQEP